MEPEWIYILDNPSLQKYYHKIGKTKRDPELRAEELSSSTGVAQPYYVAYQIAVTDSDIAEKEIHEVLKNFRVSNREFFDIPLNEAIDVVNKVIYQCGLEYEDIPRRGENHMNNTEYLRLEALLIMSNLFLLKLLTKGTRGENHPELIEIFMTNRNRYEAWLDEAEPGEKTMPSPITNYDEL